MSRSRRMVDCFENTTARSDASDQRLWHKRWRSRERDQLASLAADSDPLPVHQQIVSSTLGMAKDGKHWFGPRRQRDVSVRRWPSFERYAGTKKTCRSNLWDVA